MNAPISRREFLQATGALVVSGFVPLEESIAQAIAAAKPPLLPGELDSWIAVLPDGRVQAFFGKMDMGQSLEVAIAQVVAEELDVPFERVEVLMGDTGTSCNQGGASGSYGVSHGARPAAERSGGSAPASARIRLRSSSACRPRTLLLTDGVVSGQGKSSLVRAS